MSFVSPTCLALGFPSIVMTTGSTHRHWPLKTIHPPKVNPSGLASYFRYLQEILQSIHRPLVYLYRAGQVHDKMAKTHKSHYSLTYLHLSTLLSFFLAFLRVSVSCRPSTFRGRRANFGYTDTNIL